MVAKCAVRGVFSCGRCVPVPPPDQIRVLKAAWQLCEKVQEREPRGLRIPERQDAAASRLCQPLFA